MALLQQPIDTTNVSTERFQTLPEEWYQVIITDTDEGQNAKGNGRYIKLEFTVGNGQYSGETIRTWLNYVHTSQKAQQIGMQQLALVMKCVGVQPPLRDTNQLLNKKLEVYVKPDGTYNSVSDFRPYAQSAAQQSASLYSAAKDGDFHDDDIDF